MTKQMQVMEQVTTDPLLAFIDHNLGKLLTVHAFKMSGIVHPARDKAEERKNADLRSYQHTLKTIIKGCNWLEDEHTGKERRKEIQQWAKVLYKDGRRLLLSSHYMISSNRGEGLAYTDASKAIIDSFKQL